MASFVCFLELEFKWTKSDVPEKGKIYQLVDLKKIKKNKLIL